MRLSRSGTLFEIKTNQLNENKKNYNSSSDEDARQAMMLSGSKLKEVQVSLLLSSRSEMQKVIEKARSASTQQTLTLPSAPVQQKQEEPKTLKRSRSRSRSRSNRRDDRDRDRDRGRRRSRSRDRSRRRSRSRSRGRYHKDDDSRVFCFLTNHFQFLEFKHIFLGHVSKS